MSDTLLIRLDSSLKARIAKLAKLEGKTLTRVIRELIRNYIQERDIAGYIDQVWDEIGHEIKEAGHTVDDVDRLIQEARRDKS